MGLEQYDVKINRPRTIFTFISEGPKGKILKQIEFTKIKYRGIKNLFNLAFGDIIEGTNDINDQVISDNDDRDKVLATVIQAISTFTERYPKAIIYFSGSTPSRTRLYQIVIAKFYDDFSEEFVIDGYAEGKYITFEKNKQYEAFLITRKSISYEK
jgi:hypothetical protein